MESRRPEVLDSLRQRIVAGLHLGTLKAGDRLPSLRRAAADAHADPRVVLAAYRRLAVEGLVSLRTVYASRCASERLPVRWRRQRAVTVPRVFSAQTARALLEFQVGRNRRAIRAAAGHAKPA